jgi:hypothetical protein
VLPLFLLELPALVELVLRSTQLAARKLSAHARAACLLLLLLLLAYKCPIWCSIDVSNPNLHTAAAGLLAALAKAFGCWAAALHPDSTQQQRLRQLSSREWQRQLDYLAHPIGQPVLLWQHLLMHWPGAIMAKRVAQTETLEPAAALGASLLQW